MQASTFGACSKPDLIGRVVPGRVSGIKMVGKADVPEFELDGIHSDS